jgi:hypothetical protein
MNIFIQEQARTEHGFYFTATAGKTSMFIAVHDHGLNVTALNASHKAWRGAGKMFRNVAEAVSSYKRAESKAIIKAACEAALASA